MHITSVPPSTPRHIERLVLVTALTSVTGFLFPIHGFTPALGVGILACVILVVAVFALYKERLAGAWRWIYVITAIASIVAVPRLSAMCEKRT